ncbi:MAG: ABC transporter ATP-binding protein [Actinomycetota bacterium]
MAGGPLLEVRDLAAGFDSRHGMVKALNGVSFGLEPGERLGIVGESGSGKSVTAHAITGLLPSNARVTGEARLDGVDLLQMSKRKMRHVRGERIGMVFQNPLHCLNPSMKIGAQIEEVILAHTDADKREASRRSLELLDQVGIPSPDRSAQEYPHLFSGGMRQRVMIAIALACKPQIVIADEPTTALDVTIQAQIIDLLAENCKAYGAAVILITHDLGILAGFADRIVVMYAGRVVEQGDVDSIYYRPAHPYTLGLLRSVTRIDEARRDRLVPITGNPPSPVLLPSGCAFHPRCPYTQPVCSERVPPLELKGGIDHPAACHFAEEVATHRAGDAVQ